MVTFQPAVLVAVPVVALALARKKWAVYAFLGSIPFYRVILFDAVGHHFNLPELVVLALTAHYLRDVAKSGRVELPPGRTSLLLIGFVLASVASVLALLVQRPDILVTPYWRGWNRNLVPVIFSGKNVTQLFLRLFFVVSVVVTGLGLREVPTARAIRAVIGGVLVTGAVGLVYQFSIVAGLGVVPEVFRWFGMTTIPLEPRSIGPLPRMYTFPGEPGRTAAYLLLGLGYALPFTLSGGRTGALTRTEARVCSVVIASMILLSTATTGFGGLLILGSVAIGLTVVYQGLSDVRLAQQFGIVVGVGVFAVGFFTAAGSGFTEFLIYQGQKLMLSAHSGTKRLWYIRHAFGVLPKRPLFGVGVGSHHAPSLLATVIVESGLFGLVTLLGAKLSIYLDTFRAGFQHSDRGEAIAAALLLGGITVVATEFLVHPPGALQQPWYWVSLSLPIAFVTSS